jgi:hypothetical protein
LPDDDVELEVLHRGVEHLLDGGMESVDLIDEQNVPLLEVRQQRDEIAGSFDERSRGGRDVHRELVGDDVGQGRLA